MVTTASTKLTNLTESEPKPVLKWAGGKTQLLDELSRKIPHRFNNFIEPFFGGGALFFHIQPTKGIIADSNPELINLYRAIANHVDAVVEATKVHRNDKDYFYELRKIDWQLLPPAQAAARTIFLNKTCFNGLYRVNRKGQFNVPFGHYKNPKICDETNLRAASKALKHAKILLGDYKDVLVEWARKQDFIFLDPPYLPISEYSDFKRYTKEQFYEDDQRELAVLVKELYEKGCHVLLTNSNHPLIHELYSDFTIEIVKTKRNINSKAGERTGEDVIISARPQRSVFVKKVPDALPGQVLKYPSTRFMGSKSKLLPQILEVSRQFQFDSVLDLFSGSGIVGYTFKTCGKKVISNDYMALSSVYTKAMVENNQVVLDIEVAKKLLKEPKETYDTFVQDTFGGLYFSDEENRLIDIVRANSKGIKNPYQKAIALAALTRACTKKRPRGIFTYVGERYDDGRQDLKTSLEQHYLRAVKDVNNAVFDNGKANLSRCGDAMTIKQTSDLVYIDPPYYSPLSDNEYVRRYHFVEGLACDWRDVEMQWHTKTKKFKSYPTPFSSRKGAYQAFDKLFRKFKNSILLVSYSSNSLPTLDEMVSLLSKHKSKVEVMKVDYKYSFGTQKKLAVGNVVQEYLFVGF